MSRLLKVMGVASPETEVVLSVKYCLHLDFTIIHVNFK